MRPNLDEYFMGMAQLASKRSTCLRRQVGAIIVKEKRVLATGYNGAPKGLKHCSEVGCVRKELKVPETQRHEICRGLHSEQNAIIQAALFGVSIKDSTLYTTHFPCSVCAKMLINADIKEIVYGEDYVDELSKKLLEESGIKVRQYKGTK
ncbi:MAG: cytidine/deoxycytidylate deaminase family protein [Candidatus Thermoplasmatota archaeon]